LEGSIKLGEIISAQLGIYPSLQTMQMVQNQQDNLLLTPGMQVLQLSEYRAAAISLDQHQAELCLLEQMRCG